MRPVPAAAADLARRFEGLKGAVYLDPAGVATIGYGHKVLAGEDWSQGITLDQAETLLAQDLIKAAEGVDFALKPGVLDRLSDGQYAALIDFVFNLGAGRFAGSTLAHLVNIGCLMRAAQEFDKWTYANGVQMKGLLARREAERQLWLTPTASPSSGVPAGSSSATA